MSYELLARRLVDWIHRDVENRDYYDIMCYGVEVLLSTIGNIILTIIIAVVLHIGWETLVYCLFFIPYRVASGGAHASTHTRCFMTFTVCQLVVIALGKLPILSPVYNIVNMIFAILSLLICVFFATSTKQLEAEEKTKYKRLSIAIVAVEVLLITCFTFISTRFISYMFIASMAMFVQSMALLPIYHCKGENVHENEF